MKTLKKITLWLLVVTVVVYIISGLGITEFRIVQTLTGGLLDKTLAFRIHNSPIAFGFAVVVLLLHIYLNIRERRLRERKDRA